MGHREPYVGDGADGARRSARIDREEADGLDRGDPRRDELLASAERWDRQAEQLEAEHAGQEPSFQAMRIQQLERRQKARTLADEAAEILSYHGASAQDHAHATAAALASIALSLAAGRTV